MQGDGEFHQTADVRIKDIFGALFKFVWFKITVVCYV